MGYMAWYVTVDILSGDISSYSAYNTLKTNYSDISDAAEEEENKDEMDVVADGRSSRTSGGIKSDTDNDNDNICSGCQSSYDLSQRHMKAD